MEILVNITIFVTAYHSICVLFLYDPSKKTKRVLKKTDDMDGRDTCVRNRIELWRAEPGIAVFYRTFAFCRNDISDI